MLHLANCAHTDETDRQVSNVRSGLKTSSPFTTSNDSFGLGRCSDGLEDELDGGEGSGF